MRIDKMTTKFQMALADAQSLAVGRDHQFMEPVHLMMALPRRGDVAAETSGTILASPLPPWAPGYGVVTRCGDARG